LALQKPDNLQLSSGHALCAIYSLIVVWLSIEFDGSASRNAVHRAGHRPRHRL
jgi:hypothetical protein